MHGSVLHSNLTSVLTNFKAYDLIKYATLPYLIQKKKKKKKNESPPPGRDSELTEKILFNIVLLVSDYIYKSSCTPLLCFCVTSICTSLGIFFSSQTIISAKVIALHFLVSVLCPFVHPFD